MAEVTIHGGDYAKQATSVSGWWNHSITARRIGKWYSFPESDTIKIPDDIVGVQVVSTGTGEAVRSGLAGAVVGGLLLGPVGALMGASVFAEASKDKNKVVFVVALKSGRQFAASCTQDVFRKYFTGSLRIPGTIPSANSPS